MTLEADNAIEADGRVARPARQSASRPKPYTVRYVQAGTGKEEGVRERLREVLANLLREVPKEDEPNSSGKITVSRGPT